ncbi:hypothetical protein BH10ACI1_BH10ACI1_25310 [soil metagenome]
MLFPKDKWCLGRESNPHVHKGHRIFLPTTTFAAYFPKKIICGLDYTFAFCCKIVVRQESSSLYTFIEFYEAKKIY